MGLEGIVSKRRDSAYGAGRSETEKWLARNRADKSAEEQRMRALIQELASQREAVITNTERVREAIDVAARMGE